jgi:hypothetical protein
MAPPEPAEIVVAEEPPVVKFSLPPVVEADTEVGIMTPPSPSTIVVVRPSMMVVVNALVLYR